jgi:pyruvate dehydrogenase E2 component (dihydrolipoamide acetyltransferase)
VATEIVMPRLSDSMEEGTVLQWLVGEGDTVAEGEPLVEVETDKASVVYESEVEGTVLSIAAQAGDSVAVGALIAVVGQPGEKGQATAATGNGEAASASGRVKASPLARRMAADRGIDLTTLAGSGPQGRVVRADVERSTTGAPRTGNGAAEVATPASVAESRPSATGTSSGSAAQHPLSRVQKTIARRMAQSRATIPDFELRVEVDMSRLADLREQLSSERERPSYNDFIVRAAAMTLREFPRVNGSYRDDAIEEHARVNVGIAVAAENALVVPTIFDADRKSVDAIAAESRELAAKVRDGSITPAELASSTFSVSNLGMYGVDAFSAVINPPQAAILAVGSVRLRPVVAPDGTIVARPTAHLNLACDHRILYGADGARFLGRLRELLERPVQLLL